MHRALFLAVVIASSLSAKSSSAAETSPVQSKGQPKAPLKVETSKAPTTDKNIQTITNKAAAAATKPSAEKQSTKVVEKVSEKKNDKSEKSEKTTRSVVRKMPAAALVPPPPPDTPTLMGIPEGGDYDALANLEYMSLSAMKERQKQLNTQLLDAKEEVKSKQSDAEEVKAKATQFENLYTEGVISKHELEVSKKEAGEVDAKIARAQMRVEDLESNISRLSNRIKDQEKRVAKVKKSPLATKNKIAAIKKGAPKPVEKPVSKDLKSDKSKPDVKAEKPATPAKPIENPETAKQNGQPTAVKQDASSKSDLPSKSINTEDL